MGAGASKDTEKQKSPPPVPVSSNNDINKEKSGHIIMNDKSNTMIESTKDTDKLPPKEKSTTESNTILKPVSNNGKANLEWSNSIDSDLEHDGEDLQALQGELDQALEGQGRILKNQHYRQHGQSKDALVPQKMDWRLPDELLQQERSLLSVYKSQSLERLDGLPDHSFHEPRRLQSEELLRRKSRETNGYHINENAVPHNAPIPMQNGFDPNKYKAANTSQKPAKKDVVYLETTYKDYKVEKQNSDASLRNSSFTTTMSPERSNTLSPDESKIAAKIRYDASEELLMAEIEQDFDL